ncbi:MAG: N-acetyl sugar amidotransferase, partial [Candidatus Dadabacteria bacterium]|nr:N-acetyl sugar amidotransferase [Candidatus Dadabacteria bacterium]
NPFKITEFALWASAYIIAERFDIPLIIQGENAALTLGVSKGGLGKGYDALEANKQNTQALGWKEYLAVEDVHEKDLFMFHYDDENLRKKGIRGIWLQYFLKEWSMNNNAEFGKKHGLRYRPEGFDPASIGTYVPYAQLDEDLIHVAQLLKYVKFGFGQCMDYACYDIREGKITREEGIELVRKYDGKCAEHYIKLFCDYIGISIEEFWNVTNKFRGPMWVKDEKDRWHNTYWDVLEGKK